MTTIAYRNGVLAAERGSTSEGEVQYTSGTKILRRVLKDGTTMLLGAAGDGTAGEAAKALYPGSRILMSGEVPIPKPVMEADFTLLAVERDRRGRITIWEVDQHWFPDPVEGEFHAIGTGQGIALGAMAAGATAQAAVRIACRYDPYSRLPVDQVKFHEGE